MIRVHPFRGLVALAAAAMLGGAACSESDRQTRPEGVASAPAPKAVPEGRDPGGPFQLIDHTGRSVTAQDFRGQHMLVLFGYTSCPEVCPGTLSRISAAMGLLGEHVDRVQPLLISVDPSRDTPEVLAKYVKSFHPKLIGLTGTEDQVRAAADAYMVFYKKVGDRDGQHEGPHAHHESVSHGAFTYLMGPDGRYLSVFPYGATAEAMAKEISLHLQGG
jgi:protein SCO1/2